MRDLVWRMGFTLAALGALLFLGPGVSCNLDNRLMAQIRGQAQAPQSEIDRYLAAIAEGDRQAALALWAVPGTADPTLQVRREAMTEEMLAYGPRLKYQVLSVEWGRTCCEPGTTDDPGQAGAAHFVVAIHGEDGPETLFSIDVLGPGSDGDQATRHWAIADIYSQDAAPLAWTWR
jgi:hypothetical protein